MTRKTKEELQAEITELGKILADKRAEYQAALEADQPAGILLTELTRLQNKLAVYQLMGSMEIAVLERSEIVKNDLAEQQKKLEDMKAGSNGHLQR